MLNRKEKLTKYEHISDVKFSFTPKINEKSIKLRPRSAYEMSQGDLLKKETNNRINRLKYELEQTNELTFQPEISRRATLNKSKSVIKSVTENTNKFMQWQQKKQSIMEEKRKQAQEEREQREMMECTFTPVTRDCPAYVKRIAKSMEIVRAARNSNGFMNSKNSIKPDWK